MSTPTLLFGPFLDGGRPVDDFGGLEPQCYLTGGGVSGVGSVNHVPTGNQAKVAADGALGGKMPESYNLFEQLKTKKKIHD